MSRWFPNLMRLYISSRKCGTIYIDIYMPRRLEHKTQHFGRKFCNNLPNIILQLLNHLGLIAVDPHIQKISNKKRHGVKLQKRRGQSMSSFFWDHTLRDHGVQRLDWFSRCLCSRSILLEEYDKNSDLLIKFAGQCFVSWPVLGHGAELEVSGKPYTLCCTAAVLLLFVQSGHWKAFSITDRNRSPLISALNSMSMFYAANFRR